MTRSTKAEVCWVWFLRKFFLSSWCKRADLTFSLTVDVSLGGPAAMLRPWVTAWGQRLPAERWESPRSRRDCGTAVPTWWRAWGRRQTRFLRTHNTLPSLEAVALWLVLCFFPLYSLSPAPSPAPYFFFSFFNKTHFHLVQISFLALRGYWVSLSGWGTSMRIKLISKEGTTDGISPKPNPQGKVDIKVPLLPYLWLHEPTNVFIA